MNDPDNSPMTIRIGNKFIGKDEHVILFEMVFHPSERDSSCFDDAVYLINGTRTNITDYKLAIATLRTGVMP